jgi:ribonuclease HI
MTLARSGFLERITRIERCLMQTVALAASALVLTAALVDRRLLRKKLEYLAALEKQRESEKDRAARERDRAKQAKEAAFLLWEEELLENDRLQNEVNALELEEDALVKHIKGGGLKKKSTRNECKHREIKSLPQGWVRVYVDGSVKNGKLGAGIVLKRGDESVIQKKSRQVNENNLSRGRPEYAEACAVLFGVQYAKNLGVTGVQILSDCYNLMHKLNHNGHKDGILREVQAEIRELPEGFMAQWIPRSQNKEADSLAARAVREKTSSQAKNRPKSSPRVKDLPPISKDVQWALDRQELNHKELAQVRVGGKDVFTSMLINDIWESIRKRHGNGEPRILEEELKRNRVLDSRSGKLSASAKMALRWCARGLPAELALKKASLTVHSVRGR